jgi:hypothetical protein
LESKSWLASWTRAGIVVGAMLGPAGAQAQPADTGAVEAPPPVAEKEKATPGDPFWPFGFEPVPGALPLYAVGEGGTSAAQLHVTPRKTEVYVDGRFVGHVDQFDGFGERLRLRPGGHELVLYLEGYRSVSDKLLFEPGTTYRIKWSMVKLAAGETIGPRPKPPELPRAAAASEATPLRAPAVPADRPADRSAYGTLSIGVQPSGSAVLIDGQRWESSEQQNRLAVEVTGGLHRVAIQKDGYTTFSTSVLVRGHETTTLNVSLSPGESR